MRSTLIEIFKAQKQHTAALKRTTARERVAKLKSLRHAITSRKEELYAAIYQDYRKTPPEIDLSEIYTTLAELDHAVRKTKKWMRSRKVCNPLALIGSCSYVQPEPKGVTLIIGPWNYPFSLVMNPLISAVAAGNSAILKPSELTPKTSAFIRSLIESIFPMHEVAVVEGNHLVSQELLALPFDHIFFTGSSRVGKIVAEAAAKHLTSTTLELGGKSPAIIDEDSNLEQAAKRIVWGKFFNAGQTCVAPDYALVPEKLETQFIGLVKAETAKMYGADPAAQEANGDLCRIITEGHLTRLKKMTEESVARGATLVMGGQFNAASRYISPTILSGVKAEHPIMEEEIFGPILPIVRYKNLDEACAMIRGREKPLSLYLFSNSQKTVDKILQETTSGGTCINNTLVHLSNPNLPFGGIGQSGMGNYHGEFGFRAFSHERAVLKQGWFNAAQWMYPPYTSRVRKLIALSVRYFT